MTNHTKFLINSYKQCYTGFERLGINPANARTTEGGRMKENVNHPSHYNFGKYEVIDVIDDWKLGFSLGNAVKYIARAGKKDPEKEIEDLKKAVFYLNHEIERLSGGE